MFMVIAGNGKEYGPFDESQIREWIQNGFLTGEGKIKKQGDADWKTLADFPELQMPEPLQLQRRATPKSQVAVLWAPDYAISLGSVLLYLGRAFNFALSHLWVTLGMGLLFVVCYVSPSFLKEQIYDILVTWKKLGALSMAVMGILMLVLVTFFMGITSIVQGGIFYFLLQSIRFRAYSLVAVEKALQNLKKMWFQLVLCTLVLTVILCVGIFFISVVSMFTFGMTFLLIIPWMGFFSALYYFANAIVIDKEVHFWEAIRLAWATIMKHWLLSPFFVCIFVFLEVSGFIVSGVMEVLSGMKQSTLQHLLIGMAMSCVTWPIAKLSLVYMYDDIWG
ncbi:MAG: DUF4339 domain-containing protein [Verrucomicrobiota bacterium]